MKILEIKNLTKIYGQGTENLKVLDDVSLEVNKGDFIVLLGPSGSGKSTLLNMIAMLDTPTEGSIIFEGKELTKLNEKQKSALRLKRMGFVFQFDGLLPDFTLLENVNMPYIMAGKKTDTKAKELLKNFGLENMENKLPSALSGGEKQRGSIARALRNNPALILADEPTGNLDAHKKVYVFEDFAKLAKQGITVIMVTHDLNAVDYADIVYSLENNKLVKTK
ncbi:Putative lipoprotein-releasing system [Elusimicrobium minutum Pei191]|uniref:Putative lipoprotein-releasing system n=1 Tax=Elusimicrobium minutum (strain Pei191) TaxID=445932 RepID=B2KEB5_ELUMP|nr:ABC transporter ATP-binding protein [Elusimicrobium minutum]ACC98861.1 Putative lipoprotein-releasing system [Elusimicrobium minutum Pei191]